MVVEILREFFCGVSGVSAKRRNEISPQTHQPARFETHLKNS